MNKTMSELNLSVDQFVSNFQIKSDIEYVGDIGSDKKYGIALTGELLNMDMYSGNSVTISVVLDPGTGMPDRTDGDTSISIWDMDAIEHTQELFHGMDVIKIVDKLASESEDVFKPRADVSISNDAL